jgi:hypothetical protein
MKKGQNKNYWGEASGIDQEGKKRGVSIYQLERSFKLVDDNLREYVAPLHYRMNEEVIRQVISDMLHYRDIEFSFPQCAAKSKTDKS